jgi:multiple sugar transport system ATP-binding protein
VMNEVLQRAGTPSEVYRRPANLFVAQFIGSPVMNVLPTRVQSEGGRTTLFLADAGFEFAGPLPQRFVHDALVVGIRPEGSGWRGNQARVAS